MKTKPAYDSQDMNAAVQWAKATKEKYAQGYKLPAFRMFTQDPNAVELDYDGFCVMMKKLYNLD